MLAAASAAKQARLAAGPRAVYQTVLRVRRHWSAPEPGELGRAAMAHWLSVAQTLTGLPAADVLGLDGQAGSGWPARFRPGICPGLSQPPP